MPSRRTGNAKAAAASTEPRDDGRLASAEGRRYEVHAIQVYHEARRDTELVWPAEQAPRVLLVMAEGKECTPEELRAAVARDYEPRFDEAASLKGGDGRHEGSARGLEGGRPERARPQPDRGQELGADIDTRELGSNYSRHVTNLLCGKPRFTLIATHKPTKRVYKTFEPAPELFDLHVPWPPVNAAPAPRRRRRRPSSSSSTGRPKRCGGQGALGVA